MHFYPDQIFHIYNQGNNRRRIFFTDENYRFFLWKMRAYLLPFGDFISWCLMPNHFHWQFYAKQIEIEVRLFREHVDETEYRRRLHKYGKRAQPVDRSWWRKRRQNEIVSLNEAIGMLEHSYSQAINKERNMSGSLFRKPCKAKDGFIEELVTLRKPNGQLDHRFMSGINYDYVCFCYIHDNPEEAGLVKKNTDWPYSSARDYAGLRKGTLCNVELGRRLLGLEKNEITSLLG